MDPTEQIDQRIADLPDWRGQMLARLRALIHEADPEIQEEWKWDSPVFGHNGMVCSLGAFKNHVKLNFFKGAKVPDPKGLFNAGLDAKTTRSIDIPEGTAIDEDGIRDLVRAAVALNG